MHRPLYRCSISASLQHAACTSSAPLHPCVPASLSPLHPCTPAPLHPRLLLEHLNAVENGPLATGSIVQSAGSTTGVAVQLVTSEDGRKANVICQGANKKVGETEVGLALQVMADVGEDTPRFACWPPRELVHM